jgi:hypothetical protein
MSNARETAPEFLEDAGETTTALDEVMVYVSAMDQLQAEMESADAKLKELNRQYKVLAETTIPDLLARNNLDELKLANGRRLTIKEDVYARIPADPFAKQVALSWLEENGGAQMVKDMVILDDPSEDLVDELLAKGAAFSRKKDVNTNTLMAFFREVLGLKKGKTASVVLEDVPKEFGVYIKREAKLA